MFNANFSSFSAISWGEQIFADDVLIVDIKIGQSIAISPRVYNTTSDVMLLSA